MKLGSIFDGSGGFHLAGAMYGIEPVWASRRGKELPQLLKDALEYMIQKSQFKDQ